MLSSLYSSLPSAAAASTALVPAKSFEPKSSDEKRIIINGIRGEVTAAYRQVFAKPFLPRTLSLSKLGGKKKQGYRRKDIVPSAVIRQLPASICTSHKFRFVCTAGETISITVADIFGTIGGIGTINNSTITLFASSFKLRRVSIIESAQSVTAVSSELLWYSAADVNSADKVYMNTTIPYDRPTVISQAPPRGSLASFWWNTSSVLSTVLFTISCSIGSTIETYLDFTFLNNAPSTGIAGVATVVVGNTYYLALDGFASNKLIPVGLPSTH